MRLRLVSWTFLCNEPVRGRDPCDNVTTCITNGLTYTSTLFPQSFTSHTTYMMSRTRHANTCQSSGPKTPTPTAISPNLSASTSKWRSKSTTTKCSTCSTLPF
jgi:hypothetical protein